MQQLIWSEVKTKTWGAPDGKQVPYYVQTANYGRATLEIARWPSNTSISVVYTDGGGCDVEDVWMVKAIHTIAKLPHWQFQQQLQTIIQQAIHFIENGEIDDESEL